MKDKELAMQKYNQIEQEKRELLLAVAQKSREQRQLIIENELWNDIKDLKNYLEKDIDSITIVYKEIQSNNIRIEKFDLGYIEVQDNEKLFIVNDTYSIYWNDEKNCYILSGVYTNTKIEILGYFKLKFDN